MYVKSPSPCFLAIANHSSNYDIDRQLLIHWNGKMAVWGESKVGKENGFVGVAYPQNGYAKLNKVKLLFAIFLVWMFFSELYI